MYKITETGVKDLVNSSYITENGKGWPEYQQWLAEGNTPEPQYTSEQEIDNERVLREGELYTEYVRRIELYSGATYKSDTWALDKYQKFARKEAAGTANPNQSLMLDIFDGVSADKDTLVAYINNLARTLTELQNLDVTDDSHWTDPT